MVGAANLVPQRTNLPGNLLSQTVCLQFTHMHRSPSIEPPMSIEPQAFNMGVRTPLCVLGRHSETTT